ncbi:MAG TPA: DUF4380 domain-containing protein, partial [Prolixibacteraceae bacterium]|nr:DUF4380 domain-containing protein [Prolixibacteraceae bacterium]
MKIGLLPDVGGRMVFYGAPGGENLLFSDSTLWNEPEEDRIIPSPEAGFKPYNGHIIWLGPQSQWWRHQTLNKRRYERGDVWPPDPYLIYGNYSVEAANDTSVLLVGPESPVSGVRVSKKFTVSGRELLMEVSVTNVRNEPVAWDLWSNARFDAFTRFRIPVDSAGILRVKTDETPFRDSIPYALAEGFFTFQTVGPSEGKRY